MFPAVSVVIFSHSLLWVDWKNEKVICLIVYVLARWPTKSEDRSSLHCLSGIGHTSPKRGKGVPLDFQNVHGYDMYMGKLHKCFG